MPKKEDISGQRAHINTRKLNSNFSTITHVFLNQKRVNVCKNMVKTATHESFQSSLQIEKDICDRQNVSVKLPCVEVCL